VYATSRTVRKNELRRVRFGLPPPPLVDSCEPVTGSAQIFGLFLASSRANMSVLTSGNPAIPHSLESDPENDASTMHAYLPASGL
jgi:hypothetical protein